MKKLILIVLASFTLLVISQTNNARKKDEPCLAADCGYVI